MDTFVLSLILLVWTLAWKGVALWKAAKYEQKYWFIALLVTTLFYVYTYGLLDIIYLFWFAKQKMKASDLRFWERLPRK